MKDCWIAEHLQAGGDYGRTWRSKYHWVGPVSGDVDSTPPVNLSEDRPFPGRCCASPSVQFVGFIGERPPDLDCEAPSYLYCASCEAEGFMRCGSSRASQCAPCSRRYKRRVRALVETRLEQIRPGTALLLTLTAPSDRGRHCQVHRKCDATGVMCEVCPCTPEGGVDLADWNASLTKRTNRLLSAIKRGEASPKVRGQRAAVALEYFQAREVQRRGALHDHVVLVPVANKSRQLDRRMLKRLAMSHGFGHEVDLERIGTSKHGGSKARSPGRVAGYVSKYVTKAADLRGAVPWPCQAYGRRQAAFRTWTRSQGWGVTMRDIREAAREAAQAASLDLSRECYAKVAPETVIARVARVWFKGSG